MLRKAKARAADLGHMSQPQLACPRKHIAEQTPVNFAQMAGIERAIYTLSVELHLPPVRRRGFVLLQLVIVPYSQAISGTEGTRLGLRVLGRSWIVLGHR